MTTEANEQEGESDEKDLDPTEHRALVREISRSLAITYGIGGACVLLLIAAIGYGAWKLGYLWNPLTWLLAITTSLITLIVVRIVVYRRGDTLYERLESYCNVNDIDPSQLRAYYKRENLYPFFEALFELKDRREQFDRGELVDKSDGKAS